jgi:hypothetical protein
LRKTRLTRQTPAAAQARLSWESAALAAGKMRANAELMTRAYSGAGSVSGELLARRLLEAD